MKKIEKPVIKTSDLPNIEDVKTLLEKFLKN